MSNDPFKPSLSLDPVDLDAPAQVPDLSQDQFQGQNPDMYGQPVQQQFVQQPVQNIQQPVQVMQQPMQTIQQPIQTIQQPVQTMQQPVQTIQQPVQNIQQPIQTMQQPVQTIQQPVQNIQQPVQTIQQPVQNIQQPMGQPVIQAMGQQDFLQVQSQLPITQTINGSSVTQSPTVTEHEASILTADEMKMVADFAQKIDVTDSAMILQFGASTQKEVAAFSEKALSSVRTKDLGSVGDNLSNLMKELRTISPVEEEAKGIKALLKKKRDGLAEMRSNFESAEKNVDRIVKELEDHQIILMKDIAMFDQLYEMNAKYYKELTMYILAGKQRLAELRSTKLLELETTAKNTGSPQDAQSFNDYANLCTRFEKKLHDLDLTRMVSIQMGPQTRLLQNNNTLMLEKLQSSIVNTIPLWKSQMVIAMGLEHSSQAAAAQKAVTDMTNQMLRQNADALKVNTINTAKEMERSVVDIETLQHTNNQLISTLDEVMTIQQDGAQKRREAEAELGKIESELRNKLLEIRHTN